MRGGKSVLPAAPKRGQVPRRIVKPRGRAPGVQSQRSRLTKGAIAAARPAKRPAPSPEQESKDEEVAIDTEERADVKRMLEVKKAVKRAKRDDKRSCVHVPQASLRSGTVKR